MRSTLFQHGNFKLLRYLGGTKNLELSKLIHPRFITVSSRDNSNNNILNVIDLYPRWGPLGYALNNDYVYELSYLFQSMSFDSDGTCLSKEYFSGLLHSSRLKNWYPLLGRQCHGFLLKSGILLNQYVKATLVRVYTMMSDVSGAMEVLLYNPPELGIRRCNLILVGLIEKGYLDEALIILRRFMLAEDIVWNKDNYIAILGLCARLEDSNLGRQVHNMLLKSDVVKSDDESVCNALIKMYGKCKEISSARKVFDRSESPRNLVLWNTMLAAYLENGSFKEALNLFYDMQREDVVPNESTFCILLTASAELFSMRCGNSLHALAVKTGFKGCKKLDDTLINMYARTGDITAAENVFCGITNYNRDVVTWNMMICGYSLHSFGDKSLGLFREMLKLGEDDPNDETFVGVLSACGHMGLVEQGFYYLYELMKQKGVEPGLEHYMCIINMLIKAGQLNEALSFIVSTPSKWDVFAWTTFFRGCHDHGNYALGIRGVELIPDDVATKVSKWCGVTEVREVMEIRDIKQECGESWMEINYETPNFYSVHKGDPRFVEVHEVMKVILTCINSYTNRFDSDIEDVLKGDRNGYHSEELALAYAILEGHPVGSQINIIKASGEKICGDCHTLMKLYTKGIRDELITVRDAYQFHNFRNGHCSCADYW